MSSEALWYYARGERSVGPMDLDSLVAQLSQAGGARALVYGPGVADWTEARHVPLIAQRLGSSRSGDSPPPPPSSQRADEIDYEIYGQEMQYVEITLDPGEMAVAEAGAMMYMTPGIQMETIFGDPSRQETGILAKLKAAGKRILTGESLFMTTFSNVSSTREQVAFAAPYPGKILPVDLAQIGGELLCQKDSFLCAARGVEIGIALQKRLGAGFFGGEGFILQRLLGDGMALVHAGGTLMRRRLETGEVLRIDTGCLVALEPSVDFDIEFVGGLKNSLFGGEGLFFATLAGPGTVWCQSLPFSRLAGRIYAATPARGGSRGEGSILGGLGDMFDGDNH